MKILKKILLVLAILGTLTGLTALAWNTLAKTFAEAGTGSIAAILGLISIPILVTALAVGIIFFYRLDRDRQK